MKTEKSFSIRINGISLLIMLILMCITVFAVLSLVSANSDRQLSTKSAQTQCERSLADAGAQKMLMLAATLANQAANSDGSFAENAAALLKQNGFECEINGGAVTARFTTENFGSFAVSAAITLYENGTAEVAEYTLANTSQSLNEGGGSTLWGN